MDGQAIRWRAPAIGTAVALVAALLLGLIVTWLAMAQPWLGIEKRIGGDGPGMAMLAPDPNGPSAALDGTQLLAIEAGGTRIDLTPEDGVEEPDVVPTHAGLLALFDRSGRVHDLLRAGPVTLITDAGAFDVTPASARPLSDLPSVFWVQLMIAITIAALGGWVLSLRPRDPAAALFAAAGFGLSLAVFAAAWYSTRELALDGGGFRFASNLNMFGASVFGACMGSMMLIYPMRLVPLWAIWVQPVVFLLWFLGNPLGLWEGRGTGAHLATAVEMGLIVLGLLAQLWATRRHPKERALVAWFGISLVFGSGSFIALMAIPGAMGYEPTIRQGHAFLLFLFVYLGLAIGVARFRMFDLGDWSFRVLYYAAGAALLFAVDAALIAWLSLDRLPAFSVSLLLVVVLYLPLRDAIATLVQRRKRPGDLADAVGAVALATVPADREARWLTLLEQAFRPLGIDPMESGPTTPTLRDEGAALDMPAVAGLPALRLNWTGGGRRLFAPADRARAARLVDTVARLDELARARDRAVQQERDRIDRDVHDNIGVQLLGALHSDQPDRKNALIRQTLADLRDIVANTRIEDVPLRDLVADLRGEIGGLFEAAGTPLSWTDDGLPARTLPALQAATLRALLREATGNALRHSGAAQVSVALSVEAGVLRLVVSDDGQGIAPEAPRGKGLGNLRDRAEDAGGALTLTTGAEGTRVDARLPLIAPSPLAAAGA
ncbi:hypothetical protein N9W17_00970 [Jannaschia sp.]|nr:hypothetical protein [Jannaschia sp.]